jgi:hypothetical protein
VIGIGDGRRTMHDQDLWALEERFWTGGADVYERSMHPACVMAFPEVGILSGGAIVDAVRAAPRWRAVVMTERTLAHAGEQVVVLAYRAEAEAGSGPYRATCTSAYVRSGTEWLLAQHAQIPLTAPRSPR